MASVSIYRDGEHKKITFRKLDILTCQYSCHKHYESKREIFQILLSLADTLNVLFYI